MPSDDFGGHILPDWSALVGLPAPWRAHLEQKEVEAVILLAGRAAETKYWRTFLEKTRLPKSWCDSDCAVDLAAARQEIVNYFVLNYGEPDPSAVQRHFDYLQRYTVRLVNKHWDEIRDLADRLRVEKTVKFAA